MIGTEPIITLQHLRVDQAGQPILTNVTLELGKGELAYLIGKTGQGKTSLLKTLYADLLIGKGQDAGAKAIVTGHDLLTIKPGQIPDLRKSIGIIFQDFQLFFDRSVAENLTFVMRATGWTDSSKMKYRQAEVLMQVGLGTIANKMPYQLSGGEQQRVVIARALLNEPKLLIADEPTGNLDQEASNEIMSIFQRISNAGTTVLMATHNLGLVKSFRGRILQVANGTLSERDIASFNGQNL
jgi:cell division transport system ATP-binding protein